MVRFRTFGGFEVAAVAAVLVLGWGCEADDKEPRKLMDGPPTPVQTGGTGGGTTGTGGSVAAGTGGTGGGTTATGGVGGASGIGGSSGGEPVPSNPNAVVPGTICARLAEIQCQAEQDCCPSPGRDFASCKATMEAGCTSELMADVIAADPVTGFDPVHAEAAFTKLEELATTCDIAVASFGESLDGLRGMFKGTVAGGGSCTPANVTNKAMAGAALASCLDPDQFACRPTLVPPWNCRPLSASGEPCFTDVNCQAGLFCDNPELLLTGSDCLPRKAAGEACELPNECLSLACRGGLCAENDVTSAYCLAQ
ncbi:MAG: hypothetical protein OEZ06_27355 [Myxococcales bacterium]|nr:hypothetical protein [Myxococcales bacterium]